MAAVKIKLCGMRTAADIELANRFLPDYCGFVFVRSSRRYISPHKAAALRRALDPRVAAVGVFADEDAAVVAGLLNSGAIDIAQLHGGESESYIMRLRELTGKHIIKAFFVQSEHDIARAAASTADFVLLDGSRGGEGKAFDWTLARGLSRKFFLAGGRCAENVTLAIEAAQPFAVDISSGIERGGGKDAELGEMCIWTARAAGGAREQS